MAAFGEFEHRLARLEVVALEQSGLLELRQYAADRGQADVHAFVHQRAVYILRGQVALLRSSGRGRGSSGGGRSPSGRCFSGSWVVGHGLWMRLTCGRSGCGSLRRPFGRPLSRDSREVDASPLRCAPQQAGAPAGQSPAMAVERRRSRLCYIFAPTENCDPVASRRPLSHAFPLRCAHRLFRPAAGCSFDPLSAWSTLPDRHPPRQLRRPGDGRAASPRHDRDQVRYVLGSPPGGRHVPQGPLGLRLSLPARAVARRSSA